MRTATLALGHAAAQHSSSPPALHYWQAALLGLIQGVAELFPISSIGHTVILPALLGWHNVVAAESANESFWLAFVVGLHVGTAIGLLIFYRRDWARIISAWGRSIAHRKIDTPDGRLAWLLIVATIPAGITGVLLEHKLRVLFTKPLAASVFLIVNGLILAFGEWMRRRRLAQRQAQVAVGAAGATSTARVPKTRELDTLEYREAGFIGVAQVFALIAGISRSGITMVAGLVRGLSNEDAARFSFLLATPVILAAGVYKAGDLLGSNGAGLRGQSLVGAGCAAVSAFFAVSFLTRYFRTRTLIPFAVYCVAAGTALTIYFA